MKVAVLAHYDPKDQVRPFVRHHLRSLREVADRVVLVSNAALSDATVQSVEDSCDEVLLRANEGFDFSMWRTAIERLPIHTLDELILTNSGIFGPTRPLRDVHDEMAARDLDIWGITDCLIHFWHLQSYYLVFRPSVLRSEAFGMFWSSVIPFRNQLQVVYSYELGLSSFFGERGFRLGALVPMERVTQEAYGRMPLTGVPKINPTQAFPLALLAAGAPYLKSKLLQGHPVRRTPSRVHRAYAQVLRHVVLDYLARHTDYDCQLLDDEPIYGRQLKPRPAWLNKLLTS